MRLENAQMKTEGLNLLWSKAPLQMKTLKSQLRLRPSYNELIKEITKEEYKNKNIRDVIDRNAYYFRDSPLGTVYDNNTVDLRQQHFQKMLEKPKTVEQFDIVKDDDEMDDLRDGAIQTLSATMDDAEEHHEQQTSQMSEDVRRQFLDDLHERARVATDWSKTKYDTPSEVQSMATAKSSDDDLPPLEPLMTEDEAVKQIQGAQRGLLLRQKVRRDDDPESTHEPKGRRGRPRNVQPMPKPRAKPKPRATKDNV